MSDLRIRELERAALAEGDGEAVDRLLRARHRAGALEQNRLYALAALGVPAARALIRRPPPLLSTRENLWASTGSCSRPHPWAPWKRVFRNTGRLPIARAVDALLCAWYPGWEAAEAVPGELVDALSAWDADPAVELRERVEALWNGLEPRYRTRIWRLRHVDRALRLKTLSAIGDPLRALRETLFSISQPVWGNTPAVRALTDGQRLSIVRNVILQETLRTALPSQGSWR